MDCVTGKKFAQERTEMQSDLLSMVGAIAVALLHYVILRARVTGRHPVIPADFATVQCHK